jgi:CheY-like chemotaxis protein
MQGIRATPVAFGLSPSKAPVLLVDDEPANLLALEVLLDGLGQDLVRANSG